MFDILRIADLSKQIKGDHLKSKCSFLTIGFFQVAFTSTVVHYIPIMRQIMHFSSQVHNTGQIYA